MKYFCFIASFFFCHSILSQSTFSQFKKLSKPERRWVIAHVFKAKKALHVTKKVQQDVDSIRKANTIGSDLNGGRVDAFKHAYWMASLSMRIGARKALKLGNAHEKGNYLQFKKQHLEEGVLPDSISCEMDLHNNKAGVEAMSSGHKTTYLDIQKKILEMLHVGELLIIRKDEQGNFLDREGNVIDMKMYSGKWGNPKFLISSVTRP